MVNVGGYSDYIDHQVLIVRLYFCATTIMIFVISKMMADFPMQQALVDKCKTCLLRNKGIGLYYFNDY